MYIHRLPLTRAVAHDMIDVASWCLHPLSRLAEDPGYMLLGSDIVGICSIALVATLGHHIDVTRPLAPHPTRIFKTASATRVRVFCGLVGLTQDCCGPRTRLWASHLE